MKRLVLIGALALVIVPMLALSSGCSSGSETRSGRSAVSYTCPMHPEVVSDRSGSCPKCGMALVQR